MRKAFLLSIVCSLFSGIAYSQSLLKGDAYTSQQEWTELDRNISEYQIYKMDIKKEEINITSKNPFFDISLGDLVYNLNVYTENLTVSIERDNLPLLLGGSTRKGGLVSLTINDGFIFGFIKEGSTKIYIEPLRRIERGAPDDLFVVYNVAHVIETGEHTCGSDQVSGRLDEDIVTDRMPTTLCKIIDYAIANTFDMIAEEGSLANVLNFNLAVLNDVQSNYRSEFNANLEYDVVAQFVPSSAVNNPLDPNTSTVDASILLTNFREWARGPGNAGGGNSGGATGQFGVNYTMAGLWTARDITFQGSSSTVGLAYTPGWHHLLEDYAAPGPSLKTMVSHEIGHNWNSGHDNSAADNIMYFMVIVTDNWNTGTENIINARVNAQTYLDNCSTMGPPIGNFFQSSLVTCNGSSIEFEDQSQYGATRLWDFPTGSPASSTSEKPNITYNTNGLHYAKVTSTNAAGSDDFINYVDIQAPPQSPCTPSGSGGSGGISFVSISSITNSSGVTGAYEDFSCTDIGNLAAATSYTFLVGVVNVSRLKYFVDYNGDGDFTDAGESSTQYNLGTPTATYSIPFTSAASPVTGELIRFRITVSTATIADNGCTSPSTGQAEDYSFYVAVPQVLGCTDPAASNYDPAATIDDGSCTYGTMTWYRDLDMDTYGDPNVSQQSATQPAGFVLDNTDCDDNDNTAFPGNPEICDGVDNNCNGSIDEGVLLTWYRDMDMDNFGDPLITAQACTQPSGFVSNNSDCDDDDDLEFPGQVWFKDVDMDLYSDGVNQVACLRPMFYYAAIELISTSGDCDDEEAEAFPGNTEVCDGVDNNCNGNVDEGVMTMFWRDFDMDTYGDPNVFTQACSQPIGFVTNDLDCNDANPNAFPGNTEICDGVDNDCDGSVDENVAMTYYRDLDMDGFGDPGVSVIRCVQPPNFVLNNLDCDDLDGDEYPGQMWYADIDGDLFSDGTLIVQCLRPTNFYTASELTSISGDCDDNEANAYPGNTEVCDGFDNNCNGATDEGCAIPDCDGTSLVINNITQNNYNAEFDITSDALANNGQSIQFIAGQEIELAANFEVAAGTIFLADIGPCNNTTSVNSIDGGNDLLSISNALLQLDKEIKLRIKDTTDINITVYDKWGAEVLTSFQSKTAISEYLNMVLPDLNSGYYILSLKSNTSKIVKTILVE